MTNFYRASFRPSVEPRTSFTLSYFILSTVCGIGITLILILQVRKLRTRPVLWTAQGLTSQHDQRPRDRSGDHSTTLTFLLPQAFSFEFPWRDIVESDPHLYPFHCKFRNSMCVPVSRLYFRFLPSPLGNWSSIWISILIPFLRYLFIGEVWKGFNIDLWDLSGITLPGLGQRRWGLYIQTFISGSLVNI